MIECLKDTFNNRELATAVWAGLFFGFILTKPKVRGALWAVVRALLRFKVLLSLASVVLYVCATVFALWFLGYWRADLAKDTVLWILFSGLVMIPRFVTSREDENIAREIIFDNVKVVVLIEFLVNTYTFSFLGELLVVPVVTLLVLFHTVASYNNQYEQVSRGTGCLLSALGIAVLVFAVTSALSDDEVWTLDALRRVLLAPILSMCFVPFVFALVLVATYEEVFMRLRLGPEKPPEVIRYARRRILHHHRIRLGKLRHFLRHRAADLTRARTREDIDETLE